MSAGGLRVRLEAVLHEHRDYFANKDQTAVECMCGWEGADPNASWAAHVAEVLLQALGLREAWGVVTDMGIATERPWTEEQARRAAAKWPDMTVRRRWVSDWEVQP